MFAGEVLRSSTPWLAGIDYTVRVDGPRADLLLRASGAGGAVRPLLPTAEDSSQLPAYLLAFTGRCWAVTAGNLIVLLVCSGN